MEAEAVLDPAALARRWLQLSADAETPDHFEVNEYGEMIMAPKPTNDHQRIVKAVVSGLDAALGPEAVPEVSVITDRGVRVPDVVWMPTQRWVQCKGQTPLPVVPDVCVEVLSPGNTREEIAMKTAAYLRGGAREVIIVGLDGEIEYHGSRGRSASNALGIRLALPPDLF